MVALFPVKIWGKESGWGLVRGVVYLLFVNGPLRGWNGGQEGLRGLGNVPGCSRMRRVAKQSIIDPIALLASLGQHLPIRTTRINLPTLPRLPRKPKHINTQHIIHRTPVIPPPNTNPHPQPRDGVPALHVQRVGEVGERGRRGEEAGGEGGGLEGCGEEGGEVPF